MESVPDARLDRLPARFADVEAVTSFLRRAVLDLELPSKSRPLNCFDAGGITGLALRGLLCP